MNIELNDWYECYLFKASSQTEIQRAWEINVASEWWWIHHPFHYFVLSILSLLPDFLCFLTYKKIKPRTPWWDITFTLLTPQLNLCCSLANSQYEERYINLINNRHSIITFHMDGRYRPTITSHPSLITVCSISGSSTVNTRCCPTAACGQRPGYWWRTHCRGSESTKTWRWWRWQCRRRRER